MSSIKQAMKEKGYIVLKDVIPAESASRFKQLIIEYFDITNFQTFGQSAKPDAFNDERLFELHELFSLRKFIDPLRQLTEDKLMYLHHSDIHFNFQAYGMHDDTQVRNINPPPLNYSFLEENLEKQPQYGCYSIAIYLQDHLDGSGLTVVEGSHKNGISIEAGVHSISGREFKENQIEKKLETKVGDAIVYDARLFHKGNQHSQNSRAAIFFRMGEKNIHAKYHALGAIARQRTQNSARCVLTPELKSTLEKHNILF